MARRKRRSGERSSNRQVARHSVAQAPFDELAGLVSAPSPSYYSLPAYTGFVPEEQQAPAYTRERTYQVHYPPHRSPPPPLCKAALRCRTPLPCPIITAGRCLRSTSGKKGDHSRHRSRR